METGTRLGRFEIRGKIGAGGMGEVYRAIDTELGREAALKVLSPEVANDKDRVRRFILEAKAASALNHQNILTIYEIGLEGETRYIATELINGVTLRERMRQGDLSLDDGLGIALQAAAALCAAHEAGIIHRDIKPENIMIRSDGLVKVLDFGLAKLTETNIGAASADAATATLNTLPGMVMGTVSYMSPEQARAKDLDARSDIFSLGIVLYELFTGKRPFAGEEQVDIISSILKDDPPRLRQVSEDLPKQLERIVAKTLRKDRDLRYQHVKDLQIDLEDLREELKFEARSTRDLEPTVLARFQTTNAEQTRPTLTESISATRRFTLLHAILFIAGIAALGGAAWFLRPYWETRQIDLNALKTSEVATWSSAPGELFSNARFSPDGKLIAFSSTRSGGKNIWVKQTAAAEAIQVTRENFSDQDPLWSPKGDELAFFSQRGGSADGRPTSTGIWRVTALGGTPISVGPVSDGSSELRRWTASGKIYYQSDGNLFAMAVGSGTPEKITSFDQSGGRVVWVNISPDESTIAHISEADGKWKIMLTEKGSGEPSQVAEAEGSIGGVAWLPEKGRFFCSSLVDGTYQVFVVNVDGGTQRITSAESDSVVVDAAPDGSAIIISSTKEESNIWQVPVGGGQDAPVSRTMSAELWPAVSPDGRRVAFQSARNLSRGNKLLLSPILIKDVSARDDTATQLASSGFLPAWAPNGSSLAFMRKGPSSYELLTANPNGGGERVVAAGGINAVGYSVTPYNHIQTTAFSWSPDSSRIAYVSDRSGASNIWAASPEDGADVKLSDNTDPELLHYSPVWSSDGKHLAFYVQSRSPLSDGKPLRSFRTIDLGSKTTAVIHQPAGISRLIGWTAGNDGLIIAATAKTASLPPETVLQLITFPGGKVSELLRLKNAYYYNIFLSPDRRQIAFAARSNDKDDLWVVPAAGGEPRKLTDNNDSDLYFSRLAWSGDGAALHFGKQTRFSLLSMISGID